MDYYQLIVGVLVVWRIAHLFFAEDGPWDAMAWLRGAAAGFLAGLLDCFYCLSLWIAFPFAMLLGRSPGERFLLWPALSAGAILLQRVSAGEDDMAGKINFLEARETGDVLRQETNAAESGRG